MPIPAEVTNCIGALKAEYEHVLGADLVGMYVHGSIAMGCFNPQSSDIDVLVVVRNELPIENKRALGQAHLRLSNQFGYNIELSVVTETALTDFTYPTPYEFHYSDAHKESYQKGTVDLSDGKTDPDLAAHFVITKKFGIALLGQPAGEVFPDVPRKDYLDSIAQDAEWSFNHIISGPDTLFCRVPKYAVLNFCRVLAFVQEGIVISKQTGAEWALKQLPEQFHTVIQEALNEYQCSGSSQEVGCAQLKAFASFAHHIIAQANSENL